MRLLAAAVAAVALASCSSGAAPGTETVLDQADKATKAQVDVALQDASRAQMSHHATTGSYTADPAALGLDPPPGVAVSIASADASDFCIEATHTDIDGTWHISGGAPVVTEGPC